MLKTGGAILGDVGASLVFVTVAKFGDVGASLFVARPKCRDVAMSLFVAGAACGEIWVDSRSTKRCIFPYKMRCRRRKGKLCERTGSVLQVHGRILLGSCSNRPPL